MSHSIHQITRGAGWIYGFRWIERLLEFVSIVVLARILVPEDFGLVAIAASYVAIIEGLSDFDARKALIRTQEEHRDLYDSAWTLSTARGVLAALVMVAVAPFVGDARITTILLVLAMGPILDGMANPSFVTFERNLEYSKLAQQTLIARAVAVAVTLAVALTTRSYWALVVGFLVGSLGRTLLSYAIRPYRPRFSLSRFSDIFAFSGWMSLATMVTTLSMETDKIIVGRLLGVADAGRYFMTQRIGVLPTRELVSPLQRILYPSFSAIASDEVRLRRVVVEAINVLGSLSLPAAVGFALIANDFVPLVLGSNWIDIVPLLIVLVPYLGVRGSLSMSLPCAMALGRSRLLFLVSAIYAPIHLTLFIAGTAMYGLQGAIWSIVIAGVLYFYLSAWTLRRCLGISLKRVMVQIARPATAALVMVGVVLGMNRAIAFDLFAAEGSWLAMAIKVVAGAGVYVTCQYLLWRGAGRPPGVEQRLIQLLRLKD